jgi:hypothetical protein
MDAIHTLIFLRTTNASSSWHLNNVHSSTFDKRVGSYLVLLRIRIQI